MNNNSNKYINKKFEWRTEIVQCIAQYELRLATDNFFLWGNHDTHSDYNQKDVRLSTITFHHIGSMPLIVSPTSDHYIVVVMLY